VGFHKFIEAGLAVCVLWNLLSGLAAFRAGRGGRVVGHVVFGGICALLFVVMLRLEPLAEQRAKGTPLGVPAPTPQ